MTFDSLSAITLDIVHKSDKWQQEINIDDFIEERCKEIIPLTNLKELIDAKIAIEIGISLLCDRQITEINRQFRQKNKATNVLSFPNLDEDQIREYGLRQTIGACNYLFLGDILLSYETIKKECDKENKNFNDHLTHLILHSILHLIGYDHNNDQMAKIMESLEIKILKTLKIDNPY